MLRATRQLKRGSRSKAGGSDAGTLPFQRAVSLQAAEAEGFHKEDAQVVEDRKTTQAETSTIESGVGKRMAVEEFTTVLVHLLQYTPFR
jgi:hypothetical protein